MDLNELSRLIEEYLSTVDDEEPDHARGTERSIDCIGLYSFLKWMREKK